MYSQYTLDDPHRMLPLIYSTCTFLGYRSSRTSDDHSLKRALATSLGQRLHSQVDRAAEFPVSLQLICAVNCKRQAVIEISFNAVLLGYQYDMYGKVTVQTVEATGTAH